MLTAESEASSVEERKNNLEYNYNSFIDKDGKVCFFTGLTNWETLLKLFDFVKSHLVNHSSLSPFRQLLLMTLMRLRLGNSGVELGYKFGIHPSTISRIFSNVIEVLYVCLKFLIV